MTTRVAEALDLKVGMKFLYFLFFFSGFPALLYQLVWQRSLFTIYGVNIESITVVVAAFMLGLGLGSLFGGALCRLHAVNSLFLFAVIEILIGLYGLVSLDILEFAAVATAGATTSSTFLLSFALVFIPTLLMGATLPLLVNFLVGRTKNVGKSVATLYFVNTLGSAVACLLVARYIFAHAGLDGSVYLAVSLNFLIAAALLVWLRRSSGDGSALVLSATCGSQGPRNDVAPAPSDRSQQQETLRFSFGLGLILVALAGFISLSYEIFWVRIFMIAAEGRAKVFPGVLGFFLAGIAFGSLLSHHYCERHAAAGDPRNLRRIAYFLLIGNIVGFLVAPLLSVVMGVWHLPPKTLMPLLALASAMLGAVFPLLCHFAVSPGEKVGARMSYMYLANILGAVAGSLLTGFVLMQHLTTMQIAVLLALLGIAVSAALMAATSQSAARWRRMAAMAGVAVAIVVVAMPLYDRFYGRLMGLQLEYLLENRSGVIAVTDDGVLYGGGTYDGVFSTDLVDDRNTIVRAYALSAFHPAPKKVLMIGLGSGSWAKVIANNPAVEQLTIIEINPGYYETISHYAAVSSVLQNPKVELIVDDGRRWLRAHRDAKFDAIVQNGTFHWRAYAGNLLSSEYLDIVRRHLEIGGLFYNNLTGSADAEKTAVVKFPHAYRFLNMVVVSDQPIDLNAQRWRTTLQTYRIDGQAVFDPTRELHRNRLEEVVGMLSDFTPKETDYTWRSSIESREDLLARTADAKIVTDMNMITEWR